MKQHTKQIPTAHTKNVDLRRKKKKMQNVKSKRGKTHRTIRRRRKIRENCGKQQKQPHPKHDHVLNGCLPPSFPPFPVTDHSIKQDSIILSHIGFKQQTKLQSTPLCVIAGVPCHSFPSRRCSAELKASSTGSKATYPDQISKAISVHFCPTTNKMETLICFSRYCARVQKYTIRGIEALFLHPKLKSNLTEHHLKDFPAPTTTNPVFTIAPSLCHIHNPHFHHLFSQERRAPAHFYIPNISTSSILKPPRGSCSRIWPFWQQVEQWGEV